MFFSDSRSPLSQLKKCLLAASLLLLSPVFVMAKELLFLADHFPPYEFEAPDGTASGFDSDLIREVFKRLDIPAKLAIQPWKRAVTDVKNGTATGMYSCAYKKGRENFAYFSDTISYATQGVVVSLDYTGSEISVVKDLTKISVASISGYASNTILEDANIPFITVSHVKHGFPMLSRGRFDALFLGLEAGRQMASEEGMSSALKFIPLKDIKRRDYHLCFSKKWPGHVELANKFNRVLKEMKASGDYDAIHKKYQ